MSKKNLSPEQQRLSEEAWKGYRAAFEARGLPVPELSGMPRVQVRADGMVRTVFASGTSSACVSIKEQWAEYLRERDEVIGSTLHADVWAKRHGDSMKRGGNA